MVHAISSRSGDVDTALLSCKQDAIEQPVDKNSDDRYPDDKSKMFCLMPDEQHGNEFADTGAKESENEKNPFGDTPLMGPGFFLVDLYQKKPDQIDQKKVSEDPESFYKGSIACNGGKEADACCHGILLDIVFVRTAAGNPFVRLILQDFTVICNFLDIHRCFYLTQICAVD